MQTNKVQIMCLTETRITEEIYDHEIKINGYQHERCDSYTRRTGGVLILIRNDIKYSVIKKEYKDPGVWLLTVKLKSKTYKQMILNVIYRSPSCSTAMGINILEGTV